MILKVSIIISATVVESFTKFWINVNSIDVEIVEIEKAPITTTRVTATTTVTSVDRANNVYNECSETKSCFGLPNGCLSSKNCISLGAVIYKDNRIIFEMISSSK